MTNDAKTSGSVDDTGKVNSTDRHERADHDLHNQQDHAQGILEAIDYYDFFHTCTVPEA